MGNLSSTQKSIYMDYQPRLIQACDTPRDFMTSIDQAKRDMLAKPSDMAPVIAMLVKDAIKNVGLPDKNKFFHLLVF